MMEVDVGYNGGFQIDGDVCFMGVESSSEDRQFDEVIGGLQECLMDPAVGEIQESFLTKHCGEFDDSEENKFSYSTIHDEWVECMESVIQEYLSNHIEDFDMALFGEACTTRFEEIPPDILNLLHSFTDFSVFKEQMLAYKHADPTLSLEVRSLSSANAPSSSSGLSSSSAPNDPSSFPSF
jgi:hypothetical protein